MVAWLIVTVLRQEEVSTDSKDTLKRVKWIIKNVNKTM